MEQERSAAREVADREQSGERAESAAHSRLIQPNISVAVYLTYTAVTLQTIHSLLFTLQLPCPFLKPGTTLFFT